MAELRHFALNHLLRAAGIDASQLPAYKPAGERHYRPCR